MSPETRKKISEAKRRPKTPAQVYAHNPEAWWNIRLLLPAEVAYAVQQGYEAGQRAATDADPIAAAAVKGEQ